MPAVTRPRHRPRPGYRAAAGRIAAALCCGGWLALEALALPYAGLALEQALLMLREQGLNLVFTSQLVRPEMRVLEEPAAGDLRRVLDQLLAPHGLAARDGEGGRVLIVPARATASPAQLAGTVRARDDDRPLAGVEVRILGTDRHARSTADGSFLIAGLDSGRYALEARHPGWVPQLRTVAVAPGDRAAIAFQLLVLPVTLEEIEVTSRRPWVLGEGVSTLALERDQALALPYLGDDLLRGLTLLPGTAGNDASARLSVRGGRSDEVMVRLDGLELLEPFHLKDFNDALSIVAPATIARVELLTGGFPAAYGERMGGVLDLTTLDPVWQRRTELGLSLFNAQAASSGTSPQGVSHWLGAVRGGSLELPFELLKEEENPRFWDAFAKVDRQLTDRQSLRANALAARDDLHFEDRDDDRLEAFRTTYRSAYGWLTHHAIVGRDRLLTSRLSYSRVTRDRGGQEETALRAFSLRDRRTLDVYGLAHEWTWRLADRHAVTWGLDIRSLKIDYDYRNDRLLGDPLAAIRSLDPIGSTDFHHTFRGNQYSAWVADHLQLGPRLTLDLGMRFDENTVTDDEHLSPRLGLSWAVGSRDRVRASWGHYYQSQRVYELQVEDGEEVFAHDELAEHWLLGFEHVFGAGEAAAPAWTLRAELYQRRIRNPRVRYENLFDPIAIAPELASDRVRFAATDSLAEGLELFLGGSAGRRVDWFLAYSYATTEDRIDGRDVPRANDQRHAAQLGLDYRLPGGTAINLAWRYHAGWPTTRIDARLAIGDHGEVVIEPILGPLNGERLPDYHRVDLRISRPLPVPRGELLLILEVQNLLSRRNLRGFEVELSATGDGRAEVETHSESWGRALPSLSVRWTF